MARLRRILASRVREICDARNLAYTSLADLAGVGRATMSRLLAADRSVGIDVVEKVAEALGVDPADLLRGEPASPTPRRPGPRPSKRRGRHR